MKSVEMSRALTAAMSLRLPGTAGKLANKMRYVDSKGPLFHDGGLIRNITQGKHEKVYAVGISSKSKVCLLWVVCFMARLHSGTI